VSSKPYFERLRSLRRQLGSLLDQEMMPGRIDAASADTPGAWVPTADVLETIDAYEIRAELPGVLREDIELRIVGAKLELLGVRRSPAAVGSFHRMEGGYGPFHRILALGPDADESSIEARLEQGVLSVSVGKKVPGVGRREIAVDWEGDDA
jgi:HSP20 family protein